MATTKGPTTRKALFFVFIAAEILMLAWWLLRLDGQYDNEDFLFFQIILGLVAFPTSVVVLTLIAGADQLVPIYAGHTRYAAVSIWLVLALIAYIQWFVWTPKLVHRFNEWKRKR